MAWHDGSLRAALLERTPVARYVVHGPSAPARRLPSRPGAGGNGPRAPELTVPDIVQAWLGSPAPTTLLLLGGAALVFLAVFLFFCWLLFGRGPRRARAFRRAQRLLRQGAWQEALTVVQKLQARGRLS